MNITKLNSHVIAYVRNSYCDNFSCFSYVQQLLKIGAFLLPSGFLTQWIWDTNTEAFTWENEKVIDCMYLLSHIKSITLMCINVFKYDVPFRFSYECNFKYCNLLVLRFLSTNYFCSRTKDWVIFQELWSP